MTNKRNNLKEKTSGANPPNAAAKKTFPQSLFAKTNRGMLLDVVVFLLNLFLMRWLSKLFLQLITQFSDGDFFAAIAIFIFAIAIFVLPPLGATLKRWHFHERLAMQGKKFGELSDFSFGCIFNPILLIALNLLIVTGIITLLMQFIYGGNEEKIGGALFVSSILFGMVLAFYQTAIVYRYFKPPKNPPASEFFRSPKSETLGDVCIFLNMILFQVAWNLLNFIPFGHPDSVEDFCGRIFLISFVALMVYFPPRIFYLTEDINKRRTWLTILLANSPVILRILIGTNSK